MFLGTKPMLRMLGAQTDLLQCKSPRTRYLSLPRRGKVRGTPAACLVLHTHRSPIPRVFPTSQRALYAIEDALGLIAWLVAIGGRWDLDQHL